MKHKDRFFEIVAAIETDDILVIDTATNIVWERLIPELGLQFNVPLSANGTDPPQMYACSGPVERREALQWMELVQKSDYEIRAVVNTLGRPENVMVWTNPGGELDPPLPAKSFEQLIGGLNMQVIQDPKSQPDGKLLVVLDHATYESAARWLGRTVRIPDGVARLPLSPDGSAPATHFGLEFPVPWRKRSGILAAASRELPGKNPLYRLALLGPNYELQWDNENGIYEEPGDPLTLDQYITRLRLAKVDPVREKPESTARIDTGG